MLPTPIIPSPELRASEPTIERLSVYRRLLERARARGTRAIFSHELARLSGASPAQVRRDLMVVDVLGHPRRGYDIDALIRALRDHLNGPQGQRVALVGLGRLGRAVLSHFANRRPELRITAAFDEDPRRTGRVVEGCHAYPMSDLRRIAAQERFTLGVVAVPAHAAQEVANALVAEGVCGLLNFAPTALEVPPQVFVEDIDLTMALEKVAFFAQQNRPADAGSVSHTD
jgi:redox-sensing transcriptional repressor